MLKAKTDFLRQPIPQRLTKARVILAAMANNRFFPEPFGELAPSLEIVGECVHNLEVCFMDALSGAKDKIAIRKNAEEALGRNFKGLAAYVNLVAKGDAQKLASSGFEISKDGSTAVAKQHQPSHPLLELRQCEKRGCVYSRTRRVPGAKSYELHIAIGDPAVEANWSHKAVLPSAGWTEVGGLTAGQDYNFRLRCIMPDGPGPWSPPLPFMPT